MSVLTIKVLKDAIAVADATIKEVYKKIEVFEADLVVLRKERSDLGLELQAHCKHPSTSRVDGMYKQGGYDHVSEAPYTIVCDVCSKVLESHVIRGSYA